MDPGHLHVLVPLRLNIACVQLYSPAFRFDTLWFAIDSGSMELNDSNRNVGYWVKGSSISPIIERQISDLEWFHIVGYHAPSILILDS